MSRATKKIELKTVGYLSTETGTVYSRKSDKKRGETRARERKEKEQYDSKLDQLLNKYTK